MDDDKMTVIFSRLQSTVKKVKSDTIENQKISDWLQKLHVQGEKIRLDDNRREEEARIESTDRQSQAQSESKDGRNLTQIGINSHARNIAEKGESDKQIVNDLVRKSNRKIISISSTFPWDLFPSVVNVEEGRVTFKFSQLLTSQTHSVDIGDISNVFIESSLFFATLQVVSRTYTQNDIKIGYLNKKKALKVQKVIEGLRTLAKHDINTANYEIDELISKIGEFHTTS